MLRVVEGEDVARYVPTSLKMRHDRITSVARYVPTSLKVCHDRIIFVTYKVFKTIQSLKQRTYIKKTTINSQCLRHF